MSRLEPGNITHFGIYLKMMSQRLLDDTIYLHLKFTGTLQNQEIMRLEDP